MVSEYIEYTSLPRCTPKDHEVMGTNYRKIIQSMLSILRKAKHSSYQPLDLRFAAYDFWSKPIDLLSLASLLRINEANVFWGGLSDPFHPEIREGRRNKALPKRNLSGGKIRERSPPVRLLRAFVSFSPAVPAQLLPNIHLSRERRCGITLWPHPPTLVLRNSFPRTIPLRCIRH